MTTWSTDFVRSYFGTNEPLTSWRLVSSLFDWSHTEQTNHKVREKVFNWSEVHLYWSNFLRNPYFNWRARKIPSSVWLMAQMNYYAWKMRAPRSQCLPSQMNKLNQNPGGRFWATSNTSVPIQPIYLINGPNGLNWQCYLAGSSNTTPRTLTFLIDMGAKPPF